MPQDCADAGELATASAGSAELSLIEQIVATVATAAGASCAFLERRTAQPGVVEVLGASGAGAPPIGRQPARLGDPLAGTLALPLVLEGRQRGAIVAVGLAPERARDASLTVALEPLARAGALALECFELRQELADAAVAAGERHFRLVSGTAHHLRDLLGVSSAYLQLLETETSLTPRQQEYVQSSRRNMELSVRLMAELLDLGRVETGRMALEWAPTDVRSVIRSMLRDYQRADLTRGIAVEVHLDEALPVIRSDFDMLHRVLDTLLSNAFRYSPAGSVVTIAASLRSGRRADDPGSWICVSVSDQGPGVRQRDDVFEEIAQVEASTSPGLRLAISRRLTRLLGGDLTLEASPGPGSTFTFWLPVPPDNSADPAASTPPAREEPKQQRRPYPGGRDPAVK